jgi:hypothetical protein
MTILGDRLFRALLGAVLPLSETFPSRRDRRRAGEPLPKSVSAFWPERAAPCRDDAARAKTVSSPACRSSKEPRPLSHKTLFA